MSGERTAGVAGGSRLAMAFDKGHPALVVYLMAGYPSREASLAAVAAAAEAGADVIELGVPYSDPVADGPVISKAGHAARAAAGGSFGLGDALSVAGEWSAAAGPDAPPLVVMTYANTVLRMGPEQAARRAREANVAGFIVPDMPPDAGLAEPWTRAARSEGVDTVFLVAPTSTPERVRLVLSASSGFAYCVSTTGITGERDELPSDLADTVARIGEERAHVRPDLALAVGFGVSTPAQAASVARIADGVVVGSAAVRRQEDPAALGEFVSELAEAVHAARG